MKKYKKGDVCYIYSRDNRDKVDRESTIKSIGSIWVKVVDFPYDRFYVNEDERLLFAETGSLVIFLGTKSEFIEWVENEAKKSTLILGIKKHLNKLSLEELVSTNSFIISNFKETLDE